MKEKSLLYRYFFFDWLFDDMSRRMTLLERRASWLHNVEMRKHLPTYMRRWLVIGGIFTLFGLFFETVIQSPTAAGFCLTCSSITVPINIVIVVVWVFLSKNN